MLLFFSVARRVVPLINLTNNGRSIVINKIEVAHLW